MKSKRSCTEGKELASIAKKRRKLSLSEDDSSASCSKNSECLPLSKIYNSTSRNNKPAELFRKDLISAMKLPDNEQLDENDFWYVSDTWKQEWERGVQVPVNSKNVPLPKIREIKRKLHQSSFKIPKKFIALSETEVYSSETHVLSTAVQDAEKICRYDLDDTDLYWLNVLNENRTEWGQSTLNEETFELIIEGFEVQCFNKFQEALKTEEGLGIEYDDDVICDVCRNPECEEGNEMVFCDICNICVHQACYGITAIPEGSWVCRTCAANVQPSCVLCPNKGGAMKSTKQGDTWAHVCCALWIPEVSIVDPDKMEPISKISQIPQSRWALICTFCRERVGACIQCCVKQCKVAYHVTCAFDNGIEINAVYNETKDDDGVKLRSFCLKHGYQNRENPQEPEGTVWKMRSVKKEAKATKVSDLEKHNARLQKIREMESEFYRYVNPKHIKVSHTGQDLLDLVYCYWKLKRTANYNKPLLSTKLDESALLGKQPEDSLYTRMKMFVHLRQDLERVRNLCYMVSRREKHRRTFIRVQQEIFYKQLEAVENCCERNNPDEKEEIITMSLGESVYDKVYFASNYKAPETPVAKVKEIDSEKKKLMSASRLPNPYAKLYFNGIHTRSRGHSTTSDSDPSCSKETSDKIIKDSKADHVENDAEGDDKNKVKGDAVTKSPQEPEPKPTLNTRSKVAEDASAKGEEVEIKLEKDPDLQISDNSSLKSAENCKLKDSDGSKAKPVEECQVKSTDNTRSKSLDESKKSPEGSKSKLSDCSKHWATEDVKTRATVNSKLRSSVDGKMKSEEEPKSASYSDHVAENAKGEEQIKSVSHPKQISKSVDEKDSLDYMSIAQNRRKCRRLSVPSPVVIKVEPKSPRKRRCSTHYLEVSKNQASCKEQIVQDSDSIAVDDDVFQKGHLTMELRGHAGGKENMPTLCDGVKKNDVLINAVSLCDIKNSPSQSDKENMGSKPKGRAKRAKSQSDAKTVEGSKLGNDSHGISSEIQNKQENLKNVHDALKVSNARSSRYEMRTRNSSGSMSHDDTPIKMSEIMVSASDDSPIDSLCNKSESEEVIVLEDDDEEDNIISKEGELNSHKRTRLKSRRKRTRRRLFPKVSAEEERDDSIRTINIDSSSDSSAAEDSPEDQDSTHHLPHIQQEYKMTLRQNGKVVLSPLRKGTTNSNNKSQLVPSPPSKSPKGAISPKLKRTHNTPKDIHNHQSSTSQFASSSPSPNKVSSPRIVLKLVKDRTLHSWQKSSDSPEMHSTFKVVRNDWEMTSDSKDSVNSSELDSLSAYEDEPIGHRYLMRARSKQSS